VCCVCRQFHTVLTGSHSSVHLFIRDADQAEEHGEHPKVAYPDRPKLYPETMISDDDFKDRRDVQ
jgi:hypothetical protein